MKGLLRWLFNSEDAGPSERPPTSGDHAEPLTFIDAQAPRSRSRPVRVDGNTRTFWARGEQSATTVVEVEAPVHGGDVPVTAVEARGDVRPRGNPAFTETLFVELMRAGQFARAYEQISPECQRLWGSADNFAAAQRGTEVCAVHGVTVRNVRHLDRWTDPETTIDHRNVAELFVEYTVGNPHQATRVERTVHLVPFEGRWRSLCVPPKAAEIERA